MMLIRHGFFITIMLFVTQFANATTADESQGCPVASDEKLVCANVMCDFGSIMGEWSPECTQYKKDMAIYLAKLGFWKKPAKCMTRDEHCNKTGKAKKAAVDQSYCDSLASETDKKACLDGIKITENDGATPTLEYCGSLNSFDSRASCCSALPLADDVTACTTKLDEDKAALQL
jgi:hypothetical protein